jgi:hypothetical protein
MGNVNFLQLLLLVQTLFCTSVSSASSSLSTPPPALPWWEAPHLTYTPVDADHSWEKRRQGVTDDWKAEFCFWSHYNRTALEAVAHKPTTSAPIPWTSGRMLACQRRINATAFEHNSVYEPSAVGGWLHAGKYMTTRPSDGLMEMDHAHIFTKTPYRITTLPVKLPEDFPKAASSSRVTIVQPDAATVACPRWLPTAQQSAELFEGGYMPLQFAELWLAEAVMSNDTDESGEALPQPEAYKVGLLVQYNGVTGELIQVFRKREIALPEDLNPLDPATESFDLAQLQTTLEERQWPAWTDRTHRDPSSSPAAQELAIGTPVASILKQAGWTRVSGRVVKTESPDGAEAACTVQNADLVDFADPIPPEDQELYWDVRCDDGVYFRIPKTFHPTYLSEGVCIELGCLTRTGLQRVMAVGSRSEGGLHTTVYERWSAEEQEQAQRKRVK